MRKLLGALTLGAVLIGSSAAQAFPFGANGLYTADNLHSYCEERTDVSHAASCVSFIDGVNFTLSYERAICEPGDAKLVELVSGVNDYIIAHPEKKFAPPGEVVVGRCVISFPAHEVVTMKTPALHTAYHEAGHAVIAWAQDVAITQVTIERDGKKLGSVEHSNPMKGLDLDWDNRPMARYRVEKAIRIALAGGIAQRKFKPRSCGGHDQSDRDNAIDLIFRITGSSEHADAYMNLLNIEAKGLVTKHWNLIEALARELMQRRTMSDKEIKAAIIAENKRVFAERAAKRGPDVIRVLAD